MGFSNGTIIKVEMFDYNSILQYVFLGNEGGNNYQTGLLLFDDNMVV